MKRDCSQAQQVFLYRGKLQKRSWLHLFFTLFNLLRKGQSMLSSFTRQWATVRMPGDIISISQGSPFCLINSSRHPVASNGMHVKKHFLRFLGWDFLKYHWNQRVLEYLPKIIKSCTIKYLWTQIRCVHFDAICVHSKNVEAGNTDVAFSWKYSWGDNTRNQLLFN